MEKHFNLLLVAVVVAGLGLGAFLASLQSAQAGGQPQSAAQKGPSAGQAQSGASLAKTDGGSASAAGAVAGAAGDARSRPVTGSVASVDGDTLTVTTPQGDTKVKLTGARLEKTVAGTAEDLKPGQRVMVVAQQGQEGSYTAGSVQILGASAPQAMAGQFRGAGQGQPQGLAQNQGQAQRQPQGQDQGQPGGDERARPLAGSVVSLEGDTLTLSPQQGEGNVQVKLGGAPIQKTVEATAADLKPGVRVVVTGQQGQEGILTATDVQILPEGQGAVQPLQRGAPTGR